MRFRTTLLQSGKTATGIEVPAEVVDALGAGRKPPVRVTINGYTYRSTVAVMGGAYMVGVSAENRAGAGVKGGDEIDVELELDTAPRELAVPADFAAALDAEPEARRFFDGLSYSNRQWHVLLGRGREDRRDAPAPHREVRRDAQIRKGPLKQGYGAVADGPDRADGQLVPGRAGSGGLTRPAGTRASAVTAATSSSMDRAPAA